MTGKWEQLLAGLDDEQAIIAEALLDTEVEWLKNRPAVDQLADLAGEREDDEGS